MNDALSYNERTQAMVAGQRTKRDIFTCEEPVVLPVHGCWLEFEVRCDESFYRVKWLTEDRAADCECASRRRGHRWCKHLRAVEAFIQEGIACGLALSVEWFLGLSPEQRRALTTRRS